MKKQWALVWILSGLSMSGAFSIDACRRFLNADDIE